MEPPTVKLWPRRLRDLTRIGAIPQDGPEEALHKEVLVLAAVVMASLAVIWVVSYGLLGLYLAAAIPLTYQLVSVANLTVFAKTKRCRLFRASELWLSLVLPFLLQLSLGGFISSSGSSYGRSPLRLVRCCSWGVAQLLAGLPPSSP
jgi:adenylate cyclase